MTQEADAYEHQKHLYRAPGLVRAGCPALARRNGSAISSAQESLFLTWWLAVAEKQRRFRKELAGDIRWLLKEGLKKGVREHLLGTLEYLWLSGRDDLSALDSLLSSNGQPEFGR